MKYYLDNQPEGGAETGEEETIGRKEERTAGKTVCAAAEGHAKAMKIDRHFLYEDTGKRERNAKHYVGNDGTVTAIYSGKAVHYFDEQTKEFKEVDNSLSETDDMLETKSNAFQTRFKKRSLDGELFEVTKGNCRVALKSHDLAKNCACKTDNCTCEATNTAESKLLFQEVAKDVDIQYIVDSDRVKENIIVKAKGDKYEYDFSMNIENLDMGVSEDGKTLQLKDKESGEVKFYVPGPFMTDAAGAYSDQVYYEIEEQNGDTLNMKVVADSEWLNAEERSFPVTIDPQIVSSDTSIMTFNYYTLQEKQHSGGTVQEWVNTEPETTVAIDSSHRLSVKVDKELLYPNNSIISVKFDIYVMKAGTCIINNKTYDCSVGLLEIDITDLFKAANTSCQINFTATSQDSISFDVIGRFAPWLIVEYMENEIEPENKTFSLAGGVSGQLDIVTGELVTSFSDINAGSSALPLKIGHVHKKNENDFCCGTDWRLNLHQTLKKSGNEYFYTDGAGKTHTFEEIYYYVKDSVRMVVDKSQVTAEPSGLLTCAVEGNTYEVTRELRTKSGLRLTTRLEGVKNIQYIEQRQDEEKQLDDYVEAYKERIQSLRLVVIADGTIKQRGGNIDVRFFPFHSRRYENLYHSV